ncbi:MAG: carboxypeptidase-like regulatory domain-containing protein, partial [Candidatus Parabeggiatoa sp.]|nr:carboxypeptidase-like regulatory domain-containing protein [Candidatus Parabeggiatoa sp.]
MYHYENDDWQWGWSNYGNSEAGGGIYPYRNNLTIGDFDADGKDEILGLSSWATVFHFDNNDWHWGWSTYGSNSFAGWTYPLYGDILLIGDIEHTNSNHEVMFIQQGDSARWSTVMNYADNKFNWGWSNYGGDEPNTYPFIDDWPVKGSSTSYMLVKASASEPEYLLARRKYGSHYLVSMYRKVIPDSDGVTGVTEDAAPNNGDGNGDGKLDSEQSYVTSLPNVVTNDYISLETTDGCPLQNVKSKSEIDAGNGQEDPIGVYPQGLLEFDIPCPTANLKLFYHGVTANTADNTIEVGGVNYSMSMLGYRKYGPNPPGSSTEEWYTLEPKNGFNPNLQFGTATIGGKTILTASFTLQDGELGDDTKVDGKIVDIGGLTLEAVENYTASGIILDKQGNPLSGVTLQIGDKSTITEAAGNWEINGLAEGEYTVIARKAGYLFESKPCVVSDNEKVCQPALKLEPVLDIK